MTMKMFYQGEPADSQDFCDYDYLDDGVECDDHRLWQVIDPSANDGGLVGLVCENHKAAYKKEEAAALDAEV